MEQAPEPPVDSAPARLPTVVICIGTSHPGNVGAVARGAANFGVQQLRFVEPRCDIHSEEALNRSVHARDLLLAATVHETLAQAMEGASFAVATSARNTLAENRFLRKPLDVRTWAETMKTFDGTIALVFGREDSGMTSDEVNLCDQLVTIPTSGYSSLNLAHAVSLLSYELHRMRCDDITPERSLAPNTLAAMHSAWDDIVSSVESRHWRREVAQGIFRKMMGRSMPSDHEVHNIMGILGNVLKRFNHPNWRTEASTELVHRKGLLAQPVGDEDTEEE